MGSGLERRVEAREGGRKNRRREDEGAKAGRRIRSRAEGVGNFERGAAFAP